MFKSALAAVKITSCLLPRPQIPSVAAFCNGFSAAFSRSMSVVCGPLINTPATPRSTTLLTSHHLLQRASCLYLPTQSYKVKTSLYKRCNQCYFVRRKGRLFVECKAKGRHKQMQKMAKKKLFRE